MSKGSRQRPRQVSGQDFSKNWDAIFSKKKETPPVNDEPKKEENGKTTLG